MIVSICDIFPLLKVIRTQKRIKIPGRKKQKKPFLQQNAEAAFAYEPSHTLSGKEE